MMTAWPHKGRLSVFAEAEPVTQPMDVPGSDVPVPPVAAIAQTPMEIAEEALLIAPPAMDVAAAPGQRRLRRRWLIPAAMLSGVAHAAAIFALVNWLDLRSVEADADEVSIEIVIEPPETAGARVQQQSQLAETEAEPPPGFQPPDPFAPELAKVPDFPQPREPAIITPEMPDMIVGPPSMPPVRTFVLPTPHTLAVLAAPPRFEPAVSGARPELPVTSGAGRPEPQARSSARAQTTKPAPMAEPLHKKPEPDADKKTRRTEPKNAGKPAKERREARKDKTQEKKTEVARGGGQPAG
jgi:hypothetical protein